MLLPKHSPRLPGFVSASLPLCPALYTLLFLLFFSLSLCHLRSSLSVFLTWSAALSIKLRPLQFQSRVIVSCLFLPLCCLPKSPLALSFAMPTYRSPPPSYSSTIHPIPDTPPSLAYSSSSDDLIVSSPCAQTSTPPVLSTMLQGKC